MNKITQLSNGGELYEYADGSKHWYLNNHLHRDDGPAIEWHKGYKEWWLNGKHIICKTQEQFEQFMRLKAFW
jgi:hypothetical protein